MLTIRAFIALHLPQDLKQYLGEICANYDRQIPAGAVRWVKPEAMHLTLRFLGDTPQDKLPTLQAALDQVGAACVPFAFRLDRLGCFPNQHRPNVIWAGTQGGEAEATALKNALDAALVLLGWEKETRPFKAHLTLGRVKHSHQQIRLPYGTLLEPMTIPVAALHLVESDLRPAGPVYTTRHTARLHQPAGEPHR